MKRVDMVYEGTCSSEYILELSDILTYASIMAARCGCTIYWGNADEHFIPDLDGPPEACREIREAIEKMINVGYEY